MSKKATPKCNVSGCRHTAVTNFGVKLGSLMVTWWACDGCAKTYMRNSITPRALPPQPQPSERVDDAGEGK